jgi:hypothetical protein
MGLLDGIAWEREHGTNNFEEDKMDKFQKKDNAKVRMELIDPDYMIGVAQVLTFGAEKYEPYNWQKATDEDIERIKGAMLRHQMAYMKGEQKDPETGLNHMYHVGCNAMFLAYFDRNRAENPAQQHFKFDAPELFGASDETVPASK